MNRDSDNVGEDGPNFNVQEAGGLRSDVASTIEGIEATATMAIGETLSPAVVGPYKLLRQIGEGGMGVIYHAQQLQPIHRDVALKVIKPGMDSKQVIARFESERQALAMMDHPNIARVYDAGTTTAGLPYFVMELVEGIPITRYCDSKRLTLRERIELFIPVCQAIQHAHQKGVIHRDIKPSNILVKQQESQAEPKVIDFGLAKALGPQMSDATMMTNAGMVVGTLQYMSPEQAEMGRHDIDTRSDIYSLGVVLYELLTGTTPLESGRFANATIVEVLQRIREEETKPPSARLRRSSELKDVAALRQCDHASLPKLLDRELDWIAMKALEKDRVRRYETVNGLARDLQRYLQGEPVEAVPPSTAYRLRKFIQKHRPWFAAAAVFTALLLAAVVVSSWMAVRASRAERNADRRFQQVRKLANTFLFSFHDKIENLQGSTDAREFVVQTALEYLDSLASESGNELKLQEELAQAYLRVSEVQGNPRKSNLGHLDASIGSLRKATQLAERILQRDPTNRAALRVLTEAYTQEGDMKTMAGDASGGSAAQKKAVDAAERLCWRRDDAEPSDLISLNRALLAMGDSSLDEAPKESMTAYQQALKVAERLAGVSPGVNAQLTMAGTYQRIGRVAHELGDPEAGIRNYEEAERLMQDLIRLEPTNARFRRELMVIENFLGNYWGHDGYFNLGKPQKALEYYRRAAELQQQGVAGDTKDVQARMDQVLGAAKLGEVYLYLDHAEALRQGNLCDEEIRSLLAASPDNFRYLRYRENCLTLMGRAFRALGRNDEALHVLTQTLELSESLLQSNPKDLGSVAAVHSDLLYLADVHIALKNWGQAEKHALRALELLTQVHKDLPVDLYFLRDLAMAQETNGRLDEGRGERAAAKHWFEKALASWDEWRKLAKDSPFVANHKKQVQLELSRVN